MAINSINPKNDNSAENPMANKLQNETNDTASFLDFVNAITAARGAEQVMEVIKNTAWERVRKNPLGISASIHPSLLASLNKDHFPTERFHGDSPLGVDDGADHSDPSSYGNGSGNQAKPENHGPSIGQYEKDFHFPQKQKKEKDFHGSLYGPSSLFGNLKSSGVDDTLTQVKWEYAYRGAQERLVRGDKECHICFPSFYSSIRSKYGFGGQNEKTKSS